MDKNKNIILVKGATGNQGGAIAHQLLSSGCRVMTRNPQSTASKALAAMGAELIPNLSKVRHKKVGSQCPSLMLTKRIMPLIRQMQ